MDAEIRIRAEPQVDPQACKFVVDRPVYADSAAYFPSPEKASGHRLAERLFSAGNVKAVLIAHDTVTVVKTGDEDWRPFARKIAAQIREHIASKEPAVAPSFKESLPPSLVLAQRVQTILDMQINPAVASHGGTIELLDVKENTVFLRMSGGCQGCAMSQMTLKQGIESLLRQEIPELGEVLDTTDHAAGRNPYYSPA